MLSAKLEEVGSIAIQDKRMRVERSDLFCVQISFNSNMHVFRNKALLSLGLDDRVLLFL